MSNESEASKPSKKPPITERTESRGSVKIKIPWFGGFLEFEYPGTNRSVMIEICALFCMMAIVLPLCCYIIFVGAPVENIVGFGNLISRREHSEARKPEQVQVQTDDGIEVVELCPPCPECADDLEECPTCPICPPPMPCIYPQTILPDSGPPAGVVDVP